MPIALIALADIVAKYTSNPEWYNVDERPKSPYSVASLYAAHVYRLANPRLDSHRSLHSWLTIYGEVARASGFDDDVPSEDIFRRVWQDHFEPDGIDEIVENEAKTAQREVQQIKANTKMFEREESPPEGDERIEVTPDEKRESIEHIKPMLFDEIDFGRALNTKWDRRWVRPVQRDVARARLAPRRAHGSDAERQGRRLI